MIDKSSPLTFFTEVSSPRTDRIGLTDNSRLLNLTQCAGGIPCHSRYLSQKGCRPMKIHSCRGISDITTVNNRYNRRRAIQPAMYLYAD